jgi:hypothetical protein
MKIDFEKACDKGMWDFLEQVMKGKGFPSEWIAWVMQTVQGGKVRVNVNGVRERYFTTYEGLRQVDPLSPLLFKLVAGVLSWLLDKSRPKATYNRYPSRSYLGGASVTSNMLMTPLS